MKLLLSTLILLSGFAAAQAGELDKEQKNVDVRIKDLPATLVMRTNAQTGAVEVAHLKNELGKTKLDEANIKFTPVEEGKEYASKQVAELDADSWRVSWRFYYGGYRGYGYGYGYGYNYGYNYGYYYPSVGYYPYAAYYSYAYAGYSYAYYRPCGWYW